MLVLLLAVMVLKVLMVLMVLAVLVVHEDVEKVVEEHLVVLCH